MTPTFRARATTSIRKTARCRRRWRGSISSTGCCFDLPASLGEIREGEFCSDVTPRGKPGPHAAHDARQGINDYTGWFAGDNDMRGDYYGYDGPCPPWNDEIVHRYVFTLFALDVAKLDVEGKLTGQQVRAAMQGHVLAEASLTGTYTLNPALNP
jgi:phosphatidylethanolamine-binding protein (PEBP) family uncharacterized protein